MKYEKPRTRDGKHEMKSKTVRDKVAKIAYEARVSDICVSPTIK